MAYSRDGRGEGELSVVDVLCIDDYHKGHDIGEVGSRGHVSY